MICRPGNDTKYFKDISLLAHKQPNLEFLPGISFDQSRRYYQQAKALVNTSIAEGWPNTFLQAGMVKTPIISLTVNPDWFINRYQCGFCGADLIRACLAVTGKMGLNHYRYVRKFHSLKNGQQLGRILLNDGGRAAAGTNPAVV